MYLLLVFFVGATYLFWRIVPQPADQYADIEAHYKYGSIGSDNSERGVPFRLWQVLPEMFPQHLPNAGKVRNGYEEFGMLVEPGMDRAIGFSRRRVLGIELVGLNCAICHAGSLRATPESARQIVLGMPSNTVDLQAYFLFLFKCAEDPRFTEAAVMARIEEKGRLDWYERLIYPWVVRQFRKKLLEQKAKVAYWDQVDKFPRFGPGRIDTFNSVKALSVDQPVGDAVGTNDFPSIWHQRPKRKMRMHWDGNNSEVTERNISAAIGVGVQAPNAVHPEVRSTLDEPSMAIIAEWIMDLSPPKFPESKIDRSKLAEGQRVFRGACWSCHGMDLSRNEVGERVGTVVPVTDPKLSTDRHRLDSFTHELSNAMNTIGIGHKWRFKQFGKTDGYANSPLDGIWLRGPFLHNGSVRTLRQLLYPSERQHTFYRGYDVYDWEGVGFADSNGASDEMYFKFETSRPGNGNGGHIYGVDLSDTEKLALLEYLKTL